MNNKVLRNLSYGMYILGTRKDRNVGCIVNTAFQITSEPPTIAVSVNHDNYTNQIIKQTNKFSLSILKEKTKPLIIGKFGYRTSKEIDKFKDEDFIMLEDVPVIKDNCGYIICKVINIMESATHTVFLGEIIDMDNYEETSPIAAAEPSQDAGRQRRQSSENPER